MVAVRGIRIRAKRRAEALAGLGVDAPDEGALLVGVRLRTGLASGAGFVGIGTEATASSSIGGVAEIAVGVGGGIGMGVGTTNGLIFAASVTLPITVRCETRAWRGLSDGGGSRGGGAG